MDYKPKNVIQFPSQKGTVNNLQERFTPVHTDGNTPDDGGNNMSRFVTHEELNHAVDKLSDKIDLQTEKINTKFANVDKQFSDLKLSLTKTMLTAIGVAVGIIGLMMHFIH